MDCPRCGSTELMNDYFEDEWFYWCSFCGTDLTAEVNGCLTDEYRCEYTSEVNSENNQDIEADAFPRIEGKPECHPLPSDSGA